MTAEEGLRVGQEVEVEVGKVAHGGHFVARHEGQVLFVRHALPGELVKAKITRTRKRHAFADAVTILRAAPERVVAPCKYAGPGGCGGCDFQHVELETQRAFKQQVIEEQLQRLAGIDLRVPVVAIPGDEAGLRWRTRMRYVELPDGGRGLRQYHSHQVVEIDDCLIARSDAREPTKGTVRETVTHDGVTHEFRVDGRGFWQVHRGAPTALVAAVIEGAQPKPGETCWDLYAGVGLFSAFMADAVGLDGLVVSVEQDATASRHARANLVGLPQVSVHCGSTRTVLARGLPAPDVVVLDPPRSGAGREVVDLVCAARPRIVVLVACDPAAFARDASYFNTHGYLLERAQGMDLFPMTHHVECVALLTRAGSDLR